MIEKIRITEQGLYNEHGTFLGTMPKDTDSLTLANKINELVDAVNELQTKVNKLEVKVNFAKPEVKETFVCPEQYKWIGKLCKFWDYADKPVYGILDDVDVDKTEYPYTKLGGNIYQNCEPVKPDDDIIYRGE